MYERLDRCPLCDSDNFQNALICQDHLVSKESFALVDCQSCGLRFTNPRPDRESLSNYYNSQDYVAHSNQSSNLINFLYKIARKYNINHKLSLIAKHTSTDSILDFGCGTGSFLQACKSRGWKVTGIEPVPLARTNAHESVKENIFASLDNLPDKTKFSVITLWHVLEHLPQLNKSIKLLKSFLLPSGKILFAVPNNKSLDAKIYGEFWAGYDVPRHLYHFSKATLRKLLKRNKLTVVHETPMNLDAYYLSLLSEKYINQNNLGIPGLAKALINGWKSNAYGYKNKGNTSSIIFIATV